MPVVLRSGADRWHHRQICGAPNQRTSWLVLRAAKQKCLSIGMDVLSDATPAGEDDVEKILKQVINLPSDVYLH